MTSLRSSLKENSADVLSCQKAALSQGKICEMSEFNHGDGKKLTFCVIINKMHK